MDASAILGVQSAWSEKYCFCNHKVWFSSGRWGIVSVLPGSECLRNCVCLITLHTYLHIPYFCKHCGYYLCHHARECVTFSSHGNIEFASGESIKSLALHVSGNAQLSWTVLRVHDQQSCSPFFMLTASKIVLLYPSWSCSRATQIIAAATKRGQPMYYGHTGPTKPDILLWSSFTLTQLEICHCKCD